MLCNPVLPRVVLTSTFVVPAAIATSNDKDDVDESNAIVGATAKSSSVEASVLHVLSEPARDFRVASYALWYPYHACPRYLALSRRDQWLSMHVLRKKRLASGRLPRARI